MVSGVSALLVLGVTLLGTGAVMGASPEPREIRLSTGTEVPVTIFPGRGDDLLLWLPHGLGKQPAEEKIAVRLADGGLEVWRADLLEAHFLPPLESSLDKIPDADISELIEAAATLTGKRVTLLASARGGLLALRGARAWRTRHPKSPVLTGAVLLHPNLFLGPPEPGKEAAYHPVVTQTRLPIFILQPEQSPWRWRLAETVLALERGGSKVFTRLLPGIRDRFYFRPDATPREEYEATRLSEYIDRAVKQLHWITPLTGQPPRRPSEDTGRNSVVGKRGLQPLPDNSKPAPLRLFDLIGKSHDLEDYRGQVVLVNFWASWCPPCVHEMPSMQRLKEKMHGKPFTILAVNMAEDEQTIRRFLAVKVKADFTILQDGDGATLKRWKVFVFPTSFLVGPDGKIKYAVFGEVAWDHGEVIRIIEAMLPKG